MINTNIVDVKAFANEILERLRKVYPAAEINITEVMMRVLSHFSLLLSFSLWVLSFSPLLLSLPTSLLPRCHPQMCIKKELSENP